MMADADRQPGSIDILVNNAGISGPTAPVQDVDPDEWEAVLKDRSDWTFLVTKVAIPRLIASGHGEIIIMSSVADDRKSKDVDAECTDAYHRLRLPHRRRTYRPLIKEGN